MDTIKKSALRPDGALVLSATERNQLSSYLSGKILNVFGPPNGGKSTLYDWLDTTLPNISIVRTSSFLMQDPACKRYIDAGKLVPDDLWKKTMKKALPTSIEHVKSGGILLLDGAIRTRFQAEYFETYNLEIVNVVLDVPTVTVLERAITRIICPLCGRSYNRDKHFYCEAHPEERLVRRSDDKKIAERLYNYLKELPEIEGFYFAKTGRTTPHFFGTNGLAETQRRFVDLLLNIFGVS